MVQLLRPLAVGQRAGKDERSVPLQPAQFLFDTEQGRQTHMVSYIVLFAICHLGSTLRSGHYIAALSVPGRLLGRSSEKWMICDDGREPRLASARDLETVGLVACLQFA